MHFPRYRLGKCAEKNMLVTCCNTVKSPQRENIWYVPEQYVYKRWLINMLLVGNYMLSDKCILYVHIVVLIRDRSNPGTDAKYSGGDRYPFAIEPAIP